MTATAYDLAGQLREGESLAEVGARNGLSARSVQTRVNDAGYTLSGEIRMYARPAPHTDEKPGRMRDQKMPADADIRCQQPHHREAFDAVLDYRTRQAVRAAKLVCNGDPEADIPPCPVKEMCLTVNGRDYELGVVGGFTDKERRAHFGEPA